MSIKQLHLGYDRNTHTDFVFEIDEYGKKQIVFDEFVYVTYNAPLPYDYPKYKGIIQASNSIIYVQGDAIAETYKDTVNLVQEKGQKIYGIKKDNLFEYTGVLDINGRPIYEWDYVKVDELGWSGFAFKKTANEDSLNPEIIIEGAGGFSCDPCRIEVILNPFADVTIDSDYYDFYKDRERILEREKEFLKEKRT